MTQIPSDNLLYHLEHDSELHDECCRCEDCIQALRQYQRQWYQGADGTIRQGYTFGTVSEPKRYWGERTLGPGPNRSGKRWPAEFRAFMTWFTVGVIVGVPGTALAMWIYAVSAAFRAFAERILSLFY